MSMPALEHFADLSVELGKIMEMGEGRAGKRRIIPIVGGTVRGDRINGKILNLGADWQTVFRDGVAELDTRYAFETDDNALVEIQNFGYRHGPNEVIVALASGEDVDPDTYYMRTHARMETGDSRYAWLNRMLFVGTGSRMANSVVISLYLVR